MTEVKEIDCLHETKISNGFLVCIKCGKCEETDYFILDPKEVISRNKRDFDKIFTTLTDTYTVKRFKTTYKYNRLMKIDKSSKNKVSGYISLKTTIFMNRLSEFLNKKQLNDLNNFLWNKEAKSIKELFQLVFYYVDSMNLPIITSELVNIIKQDQVLSSRIKIYRDIERFKKVRDYYWYISKRLSEIHDIPINKHYIIFTSIKEYYDIIRFKLLDSCNPINLINYLIYETINQHFSMIPKQARTLKRFGISHCFKLDNQKYLMKLKQLNLDEKIALKLIFVFNKYKNTRER